MFLFFAGVHILLCVFMMFVILLQPGKDAGMGSALGGGASTTVFGGRGAVTFLGKVTAVCAIGYFLTSLGLSFVGLRGSVAAGVAPPPAAPTAPAPVDKVGEQKDVKPAEGAPAAPAGDTKAADAKAGEAPPAGADTKAPDAPKAP